MTANLKYFISDSSSMNEVKDSSVALVVTSPPYPMVEMWDRIFSSQNDDAGASLLRGDGDGAFEAMHTILDAVWKECMRVLIPGGFLCINIGDAVRTLNGDFRLYPNHSRILSACGASGFSSLPPIIWRKQTNAPNKFMGSGMLPAGAYVTLEHEYILILRKGGKRAFGTPEERLSRRRSALFWEERNAWFSDLWDFKGARQDLQDSGTRDRSAAFPFELAYRLVNMYSMRGDAVLDPFTGTGTTGSACLASGRNFTGYELDPGLLPGIVAGLRNFSAAVNGIILERLERHLRFIERYEAEGKTPGHTNAVHGFPVITSQETDLAIGLVNRIEFDGETVRISYREASPERDAGRPVLLFRRAADGDIPGIMELIRSAISRLRKDGIDQWDDVYPSETVFRHDIAAGTLFLVEIPGTPNGNPAACFTADTKASPEYAGIAWNGSPETFLVLHRLCVAPHLQGLGIGRAVMEFVGDHAIREGFSSIRLDAFTENPRSLALYDSLGFARRGTVKFRKGAFMCFEYDLRQPFTKHSGGERRAACTFAKPATGKQADLFDS